MYERLYSFTKLSSILGETSSILWNPEGMRSKSFKLKITRLSKGKYIGSLLVQCPARKKFGVIVQMPSMLIVGPGESLILEDRKIAKRKKELDHV